MKAHGKSFRRSVIVLQYIDLVFVMWAIIDSTFSHLGWVIGNYYCVRRYPALSNSLKLHA